MWQTVAGRSTLNLRRGSSLGTRAAGCSSSRTSSPRPRGRGRPAAGPARGGWAPGRAPGRPGGGGGGAGARLGVGGGGGRGGGRPRPPLVRGRSRVAGRGGAGTTGRAVSRRAGRACGATDTNWHFVL